MVSLLTEKFICQSPVLGATQETQRNKSSLGKSSLTTVSVGNLYPYGYSSRCKYICHKHQKVKQQHRIKACFKITVKVMSKDK